MSGRIEMYDTQKEITSKWSKNESFNVRPAGVDIGKDDEGGSGGTTDYPDLNDKPQINGHTLVGNMSQDDLGITGGEPLTNEQMANLISILS